MTADELKHFLGLKYNKILEINLKQKEKALYGKLRQIITPHGKKLSQAKDCKLDFDIIKDVDGFKLHRESRRFLKSQEIPSAEIDSIGVVEL
jgi:hypothetical protein